MNMKRYITILCTALVAMFCLASCEKDTLSEKSVIKVANYEQNDFDKWLEENFVNPYNIQFVYRFEMKESDLSYYTVPPTYELAVKMAHLVKYLCVDTYDEVAGTDFTKGYFPKMFFLIGEWEYRNNGTFILGTAEGGKKILLSGVNYLDYVLTQGADQLNHYYIKTIHHEFTHILNQTRNYPTSFGQVNGSGYVADSWSEAPYNVEYLQNGFITSYAQHSAGEDFAETVSIYITNPQSYWDSCVAAAGEGGSYINEKLDIAKAYMLDVWNVDMDELRATILRRQKDVVAGKVDLDDITVE